jgi:hypothetical protein
MKLKGALFNRGLVLKFIKAKITGEMRSKLLMKDSVGTWEQVRATLEENDTTWSMIHFYACKCSAAGKRNMRKFLIGSQEWTKCKVN